MSNNLKPTKRKAFNFLRSYFDVLNELDTDKDKLDFLLSIINKQFLDEDPKGLNFIVNLCYESQRHSVESSVKGWKRVNGCDPVTNPPTNPPTNPQEEEEEEEVKGEEEGKGKGITTLGFGELFFSVTSPMANAKKYIVRGAAGLVQLAEINNSVFDQPEMHESFCKHVNGDIFNEFMHVKNSYKNFLKIETNGKNPRPNKTDNLVSAKSFGTL